MNGRTTHKKNPQEEENGSTSRKEGTQPFLWAVLPAPLFFGGGPSLVLILLSCASFLHVLLTTKNSEKHCHLLLSTACATRHHSPPNSTLKAQRTLHAKSPFSVILHVRRASGLLLGLPVSSTSNCPLLPPSTCSLPILPTSSSALSFCSWPDPSCSRQSIGLQSLILSQLPLQARALLHLLDAHLPLPPSARYCTWTPNRPGSTTPSDNVWHSALPSETTRGGH